jgi:hypothetical protein
MIIIAQLWGFCVALAANMQTPAPTSAPQYNDYKNQSMKGVHTWMRRPILSERQNSTLLRYTSDTYHPRRPKRHRTQGPQTPGT